MLVVAWFKIFLLTEQTTVADQSREAETAKIKAKALGEKVGSKSNEMLSAPTPLITRVQAQAVSARTLKSLLAMQSRY